MTVAGQTFSVTVTDISSLQIGSYVVVGTGLDGAPTTVAALPQAYVPGASVVRIKGLVRSVSSESAVAWVEGVALDYSAALASDPRISLRAGSMIEFSGIQPAPGGLVLVAR